MSHLEMPPPVTLAREIAPTLSGLSWGIGGSVLMWKLGLEAAPRDLDVVTTAEDFGAICECISRRLGPAAPVPHATYQSKCFARFAPDGPVSMDLFADVSVSTPQGILNWVFDPGTVRVEDGLPWMRASDWVDLYSLFDRPKRAQALRDYLSTRSQSLPTVPRGG